MIFIHYSIEYRSVKDLHITAFCFYLHSLHSISTSFELGFYFNTQNCTKQIEWIYTQCQRHQKWRRLAYTWEWFAEFIFLLSLSQVFIHTLTWQRSFPRILTTWCWCLPGKQTDSLNHSLTHFPEPARDKWSSAVFQSDLIFHTIGHVGQFRLKIYRKIFRRSLMA